jgi:hypothetical protein
VDTIDSVEKSSFLDRKRRGGKSIWEWMQVFIVPFAIALFTVVFSVVQSCSQRQIEDQRAQDAALQAYLDQMSTLLQRNAMTLTRMHATGTCLAATMPSLTAPDQVSQTTTNLPYVGGRLDGCEMLLNLS